MRRTTIWVVLFSFVLCALPIPIPSLPKWKVNGVDPYPCENCPCGCDGPKKCWTSCCCMTPAERLAWAEARGVTPPIYAKLELAAKGSSSLPSSCRSCCQSKAKKSATNGLVNRKCCTERKKKSESKLENTAGPKRKFVIGIIAVKCKGLAFGISQMPIFDIPRGYGLIVSSSECTMPLFLRHCGSSSSVLEVPTPPPRFAATF